VRVTDGVTFRRARSLLVAAVVILGAGMGAAGCSHPQPARPGQTTPRERLDQLLDSLPACPAVADALTVTAAAAPGVRGQRISVRGHLLFAPFCTSMPCREGCCHRCGGSFELGLLGEGAPPSLLLHAADRRWRRLSWTALDCEIPPLRAHAGAVTVVATGTVRRTSECSDLDKHAGPLLTIRDELVYTGLCVVRGR